MTTSAFSPKFMKVGVLTAALQELTPREVRDPDPDRAIEEWLDFAREMGAGYIQLSSALHPTESDVPPEAMLASTTQLTYCPITASCVSIAPLGLDSLPLV